MWLGAAALCILLLSIAGPAGEGRESRQQAANPAPTIAQSPVAAPDRSPGSSMTPVVQTTKADTRIPKAERLHEIPVLMYHEIGDEANNNYVSAKEFAAQMDWLAQNGYHGVTLGQVYHHLYDGAPIPPKPVGITFDDGYKTFATIAVPILRQHQFGATNFVITGSVGQPGYMNWGDVVALPKLGMEVGAHTVNHLDLRTLKGDRLRHEIADSRRDLEEHLGIPVEFFNYPAGRYNDETVKAVEEAGFLAAVTTDYGPAVAQDSPYLMERVRVLRDDSVTSLGHKVIAASDKEPQPTKAIVRRDEIPDPR